MSDEEFDRHKKSLAKQRLEKPDTMGILTSVYWCEISTQQYNFDRANIEVAYLMTVTKQQIVQFFKVRPTPQQHLGWIHLFLLILSYYYLTFFRSLFTQNHQLGESWRFTCCRWQKVEPDWRNQSTMKKKKSLPRFR